MTNEVLAILAFAVGVLLGVVGIFVAREIARERASFFRPIDRPLPPPRRAPVLLPGLVPRDAEGFRALPHETAHGAGGPLCWTCGRPKSDGTHPNC